MYCEITSPHITINDSIKQIDSNSTEYLPIRLCTSYVQMCVTYTKYIPTTINNHKNSIFDIMY